MMENLADAVACINRILPFIEPYLNADRYSRNHLQFEMPEMNAL